MNSAPYWMPSTISCDSFEARPADFIPIGSLFPSSKRGGASKPGRTKWRCEGTGMEWVDQVSPVTRWALRVCPEERKNELLSEVIRQHRVRERCPGGISWWLPVELGGLGLPTATVLDPEDFMRLTGEVALAKAWLAYRDEELAPTRADAPYGRKIRSTRSTVCQFNIRVCEGIREGCTDPFSGVLHDSPDWGWMAEMRYGKEPWEERPPSNSEFVQWNQQRNAEAHEWIQEENQKCPSYAQVRLLRLLSDTDNTAGQEDRTPSNPLKGLRTDPGASLFVCITISNSPWETLSARSKAPTSVTH